MNRVSFGGPDPWDQAPVMPAPQPEAETEVISPVENS